MRRGICALVAAGALAAPSAADEPTTVVGEGTTAWGAHYTLTASKQHDDRCLDFTLADGRGGVCTNEELETIDVQGAPTCTRTRNLALFGWVTSDVASVRVRLSGGRSLRATRFDPVPSVESDVAYWVASTRGEPRVLSVTAVAADGRVLRRIINPLGDERELCGRRHVFRGRRFLVASGSLPPQFRNWALYAYRRNVREEGERTHRDDLCTTFKGRNVIDSGGDEQCGQHMYSAVKAFTLGVEIEGCRAGTTVVVHGLARARVARLVLKRHAGWTPVPLVEAPAWLRVRSRFFAAAAKTGAWASVLIAQDRAGREIARFKIPAPRKPIRVDGHEVCGSGFLISQARSGA